MLLIRPKVMVTVITNPLLLEGEGRLSFSSTFTCLINILMILSLQLCQKEWLSYVRACDFASGRCHANSFANISTRGPQTIWS